MDYLAEKKKIFGVVFVWTICFTAGVNGYNTYLLDDLERSFHAPDIVPLEGYRVKRDLPTASPVSVTPPVPQVSPVSSQTALEVASNNTTNTNQSDDSNRTVNVTNSSPSTAAAGPTSPPVAVAAVTQIPLLGQNGTGIYRGNATNTPRVSEPISITDDNITSDIFTKESPETLKAEQNITNLTFDTHSFYNSSFIGNLTYFNEYWANITKTPANVHAVLSNSHRRATTLRLSFDFPFYGHPLRNITVATGGFIYTGEHVHNWLAATQYIAPLMANFDTTLTNDSYVKMYDDGEKFTAFWEDVTLQEDVTKKFTFSVTLYKNGDIIFAYKTVPIPVQNINDNEHPVKVGISDAYLNDRILFLIRRKTIYEYHRVSFKNYEITNGTILKLVALPTCLQYKSCNACLNHDTGFDCMWCENIHKCSSGTDRNKQDWLLRSCDKSQISNVSACPAVTEPPAGEDTKNTAYQTDSQAPLHPADVNTLNTSKEAGARRGESPEQAGVRVEAGGAGAGGARSPVGGVVAAFVAVTLIGGAAAWALYAFKNPHTRSGQLLIKYRPSQWHWRRGEARYTAATIHM